MSIRALMPWFCRRLPSDHLIKLLMAYYRSRVKGKIQGVNCRVADLSFSIEIDVQDIYGYTLLMRGQIEPFTSYLIRNLSQPNTIMLDIGANVGYFTVLAALACPKRRVLSFEPVPASIDLLRSNIVLNGIKNVELHQIALSDNQGSVVIDVFADGAFSSVHVNNNADHPFFERANVTIQVPSMTLDSLFPEGEAIGILKIDIEGYEYNALKGAEQLLTRTPPGVIICEIESSWLSRFGASPQDLIVYLESYGYHTFGITRYGLLDKALLYRYHVTENYVFVQGHQLDQVLQISAKYYSGFRALKASMRSRMAPIWRRLHNIV